MWGSWVIHIFSLLRNIIIIKEKAHSIVRFECGLFYCEWFYIVFLRESREINYDRCHRCSLFLCLYFFLVITGVRRLERVKPSVPPRKRASHRVRIPGYNGCLSGLLPIWYVSFPLSLLETIWNRLKMCRQKTFCPYLSLGFIRSFKKVLDLPS